MRRRTRPGGGACRRPAQVVKELGAAAKKPLAALRKAHVHDLAPLLARVRVDWGRSDAATLAHARPTPA